ncbi:tRNA (guanine-N7-)-methyltransferase [Aureococcus anophagefferens]|nr:tRNA (guanine-N7-)-methyltransferase [Aureococcus anophagefferens]
MVLLLAALRTTAALAPQRLVAPQRRGLVRLLSTANVQDAPAPKRKRVKRIRQHINPLASKQVQPAVLADDWFAAAFADPGKPLIVDVGSALGGWVVESAADDGGRNWLGLEIRPAAHDVAVGRLAKADVGNAHFLQCNANFPDPHFKKKHHKRRVVTPELRATIAAALAASTFVSPSAYLVSDVLEAATAMRDEFRGDATLVEVGPWNAAGWLEASPLAVPTERERCVLAGKGETSTAPGTAFRALFTPN